MKKALPWILAIIPAFVFIQSLPFKFTGAPETNFIFSTIGEWIGTFGAETLGMLFSDIGAILIGSAELVAAILLLIPATRRWGALLGSTLLSGAIFFHIASPLGIAVQLPGTDAPDPTLFILACVGLLACVMLIARGFVRSTPATLPANA